MNPAHLEKWPNGDAGDALDYALDHINDSFERTDFLESWREGDVHHWPEYSAWLRVQYLARGEQSDRSELLNQVQR